MVTEQSDQHLILQVLADVGTAFTRERQLGAVLDRLLESTLRVVEADAGSIMLLSRDRDTLVVAAARGPRAEIILGTRQAAERSVAGWAIRAGQALLLHGEHHSPASDHPRDLTSSIVVPLAVAGQVVGVLSASREAGTSRMSEQSARLLDLLANQAAILIDNARMVDELRRKDERLEQLLDQLLSESGRPVVRPPRMNGPLTKRERDVLELLVDGLTNREIAARLIVEPDTVKDHVQSIIKKLNAADRTHAAVIAVRAGLVA